MAVNFNSDLSTSAPSQDNKSLLDVNLSVLRKIIGYFSADLLNPLIPTCRKLAIIILSDPSRDLHIMNLRAVKMVLLSMIPPSNGPTGSYLNSNPQNPKETTSLIGIRNKMRNDFTVGRAVNDICSNERAHSNCIPLYHAMELSTYLFTHFTRSYLSSVHSKDDVFEIDNPLIRFPISQGPKTVKELHDLYPPNEEQGYDHIPEVQREILSLSPYLFSNLEVDGESTWHFFLNNRSVNPPTMEKFFDRFCTQYNLILPTNNKEYFLEKFNEMHSEFIQLGERFARLSQPASQRETVEQHGVLLQILVPEEIIDEVCYASQAYGKVDLDYPQLSKTLMTMRSSPRLYPNLQVRMLAQSLLVPNHNITVIPHGFGDFFTATPETLFQPSHMSGSDFKRLQNTVSRRLSLQDEMQDLMRAFILASN